MTVFSWIQRRERGLRHASGERESIHRAVYSSVEPFSTWNSSDVPSAYVCEPPSASAGAPEMPEAYGGVYNLEFSPDGSQLVAACEKRSIVIFDPITNQQTKVIKDAHTDCVNCVKFLDDRMFATCSDDFTIALWDTRNLKKKLRCLQGHENWVKNIEYSSKNSLLVTSGFDGSVFTWDINSYTENGLIYQKVFHTAGLMRCRISPDANKLVISTTGGYLIIVHHLDLTTLAQDLAGFRPNIYRLMQMGQQYIPYAATFDHLFSKAMKKNRVELASDFPAGNEAEVISSLQIHPQGWCALSRNISYDESSEWTCVHDIQEWQVDDDDDEEDDADRTHREGSSGSDSDSGERSRPAVRRAKKAKLSTSRPTRNRRPDNRPVAAAASAQPTNQSPDIWAVEQTVRDRICGNRSITRSNRSLGNPHVYGIRSGVLELSADEPDTEPDASVARPIRAASHQKPSHSKNATAKIPQNMRRMLKYIEEPNKGKGFIKELCFSSDGRIICSPYGCGIRLLAFSPDCSELPNTLHPNGEAQPLVALKYVKCHSDIVVSTKFSPRQPLFASGCLNGKVVWHQPNF